MLCAASIRVGPLRQSFWAIWDRSRGELRERTRIGRGRLALAPGALRVDERDVQVELELDEAAGAPETVARSGPGGYAWTRKQGGIGARGTVTVDGRTRRVSGRAVIDDTAAYYERHTAWLWSAGVGTARGGRALAWNLVSGVNDDPRGSERTVWVEGAAHEVPPVEFAPDLSRVADLRFAPEATRERNDNLLLIRSSYRQPFGTFAGPLPNGIELADGYGVMEAHEAWW
jgi:hypothetical protein